MKTKILSLGIIAVLISGCASITPPIQSFGPTMTPDGTKGFAYTLEESHPYFEQVDKEEYAIQAIGGHMAQQGFCENGFEITKKYENEGFTTYEGKCK